MGMRGWVLAALFGFGLASAGAQAPAAGATVEPSKALDVLLSNFEKDVVPAAKAMPAEKYGFSPDSLHIPGAKYDGVLTFAGEVAHLAEANYSFAAGIMGSKPTVDLKAVSSLKGKEEAVKALEDSFAAAHQAIATITLANEHDAVRGGMNKAVLAAYIPTHGFDHYGQMVEYLRMNGIIPPASAK